MLGLLGLFINWYMLALVVVVLAGAALIYFTQGPVVLLQDAADWHTWALIVCAAVLITMYSNSKTIAAQQTTIATQKQGLTAGKDAVTTVTNSHAKTEVRTQQADKQQAAINRVPPTAKPGAKLDALLDEIAIEEKDSK